ncbi:hypothetical protein B7R21_04790 [Subtercola boreus]|uniref:Uncharacterized protein n=1 Tax=Subtercola boreus TaxID=120213 RepID=A0A3E0W0F0_9MICO|nr:hypothetical protein [Subtercola boreus]RFA15335.1 hypothetical protein B7R21_04790 [Subtercola boreus]
MPVFDSPSRCSLGQHVRFRWYGYPPAEVGDDIETAVDVLFESIDGGSRVWNLYNERMVRSEFRARILSAQRGELSPIDEIKSVDVRNPPPLYEIRWQGITVTSLLEAGKKRFDQVLVRQYHSEPVAAPGYFIGHHAHEKVVSGGTVSERQDAEIAVAKRFYDAGSASGWGIEPGQRVPSDI